MQRLNILVVLEDDKSILTPLIRKSKYLNKLYSTIEIEGGIEVKFNTFRELAEKCKALQVDMVVVENEKLVRQGIADILRKRFINCFALTSIGNKLLLSNRFTRELLNKYEISTPKILSYPKDYPIVVRTDGMCKTGYSLDEIIKIRESISRQSAELADKIFLEEFICGQPVKLVSLFDGKTLLSFSENSLVREYSEKLCRLLIGEKIDFIGFITSKLLIAHNKVYNLGFSSKLSITDIDLDFIYLLNAAIYQKLDEIHI